MEVREILVLVQFFESREISFCNVSLAASYSYVLNPMMQFYLPDAWY